MSAPTWRPERPSELAAGVLALRSELAAAGFTVTSELDLPRVERDPGRTAREVVFGPSVRLDVRDDHRGARTATRVYAVPEWEGALAETTVVLAEWWAIDDYGLGVVGFGAHLRATLDAAVPSDLASPSNEEVESFLDLLAASPFAPVLDGSGATLRTTLLRHFPDHHGSVAFGRALALDDDVPRVTLEYASGVLTDLVAGAPIEWVLRHSEGRDS